MQKNTIVTMVYDRKLGKHIGTIDPEGRMTTFIHSKSGKSIKTIHPDGTITREKVAKPFKHEREPRQPEA